MGIGDLSQNRGQRVLQRIRLHHAHSRHGDVLAQRRHNGEWNAAAIAALSIITGNIGREGTCPGITGKGMQMNFDGGMSVSYTHLTLPTNSRV